MAALVPAQPDSPSHAAQAQPIASPPPAVLPLVVDPLNNNAAGGPAAPAPAPQARVRALSVTFFGRIYNGFIFGNKNILATVAKFVTQVAIGLFVILLFAATLSITFKVSPAMQYGINMGIILVIMRVAHSLWEDLPKRVLDAVRSLDPMYV